MTLHVPDWLTPLLDSYVDSAKEFLTPPPARVVQPQPGAEVAWDGCCDGMMWGRLVRVVPIIPGGGRRANGLPCGVAWWEATLAVGVLRCVAVLSDKGVPPTPDRISRDGVVFADDAVNLLQSVLCLNPYSVLELLPLGPQGGCAGSEVTFTVRVPVCPCPEPHQ